MPDNTAWDHLGDVRAHGHYRAFKAHETASAFPDITKVEMRMYQQNLHLALHSYIEVTCSPEEKYRIKTLQEDVARTYTHPRDEALFVASCLAMFELEEIFHLAQTKAYARGMRVAITHSFETETE